MATTTNFGWETPDDTDLVKDGAAAMRTLGNSIDTSFVDLKGGTTGQILAKASNTDLDYTWITNDVGDITAVNAGTGLTGGGTSGSVTLSLDSTYAIPPTIVDAKGDIIAATAADTVSRLAVGTNGQVLIADSTTATGLKWGSASPSYTWTSWTPVYKQGATTLTTSQDNSRYMVIGKNVFVVVQAYFNSTGTANAQFRLTSLPVAASATGYGNYSGGTAAGTATLYDTSASSFTYGLSVIPTDGTVLFVSGSQKSSSAYAWGYTGSDWPQTIASGDVLTAIFSYITD